MHDGAPHWLMTPPPPQVCPVGHGKQSTVRPPHPSLCFPQVPAGYAAHVFGVHVGTLHVPTVAPGADLRQLPPQQSALIVQLPLLAMQAAPQTNWPVEF